MVRVLSVYHFLGQKTKTIEDIVDSCLIPNNRLVLAKRNGFIEIFDLNEDGDDCCACFATIDDVVTVEYCIQGNYLVCLEEKISKGKCIKNIRVYCHFEAAGQDTNLGIKARIAGKTTPIYSTSETRCLEMLELPTKQTPEIVACCQPFLFKYCYNDSTKYKFIDFIEANFYIELDFKPTRLEVTENICAAMNQTYVNVFQIIGTTTSVWHNSSNEASTSSFNGSDNNHNVEPKLRIDLSRDLDYNLIKDKKEINDQIFQVDITSKAQQTQQRKSDFDSNEMKPIVVNNLQCVIKFFNETTTDTFTFDIQSLLQLKLAPVRPLDQLSGYSYKFLCLTLRPIYMLMKKDPSNMTDKRHIRPPHDFNLESRFHENFVGCSVLVTTQQDGYLYQVYNEKHSNGICFAFPFTSPVRDVALDDTTLHALTDNGIESYTVRTGHRLFNDLLSQKTKNSNKIVPNMNKSICLIGLRPFLGVRKILLSDKNLVLLANSINSPGPLNPGKDVPKPDDQGLWTIYNLQIPSPDMIYRDFEDLAKKKYSKNRNAFIDLIEEAHIILRTNLEVAQLVSGVDRDMDCASIAVLKENDSKEVAEMYKDSCILLGDLYALSLDSTEYKQSLPYYLMAGLTLIDIFKRLKKLQNGEMKCITSLIFTLKTYLTQIIPNSTELDALLSKTVRHEEFIPSEQFNGHEAGLQKTVKFGEIIIEVLAKYSPSELSPMILQLPVFMDYIGSGMFEVIKGFTNKTAEDIICLIFYLMKRNDIQKARLMFDEINHEHLKETLQKNYRLLFDSNVNGKGIRVVNFSEFTEIFFLNTTNIHQQQLFTDICLFVLTETQFLDYETLLKMFMDYLSALIGNNSYINGQNLVQNFLEKYFIHINVKRCLGVSSKTGDDYTSMDVFSSNSEPASLKSINDISSSESENSLKKSIRILLRLYLTHLKYATTNYHLTNASHSESLNAMNGECLENELKIFDEKIENFITRYKSMAQRTELLMHNNTKNILFFEHRYNYLTLMPPFEENLLVEGIRDSSLIKKLERDTYLNILKLQSILCNQEISAELHKDVLQFMQQNSDLIGIDAILSCIYPTNVGMEFILEKCPQAILEYAINRYKTDTEWISLIKCIQGKINAYDETEDVYALLLYYRIFKEILEYVAVSYPLEITMKILHEKNFILKNLENSNSIPNFKYMCDFTDYINICSDTKHSAKLKQMIEQTGHQLFEAIKNNKRVDRD
uniref:CSON013328 protein n=1 Tax=Culicoides sonorensis TaxID=179676 RepID=A0A336M7N6_CULSO